MLLLLFPELDRGGCVRESGTFWYMEHENLTEYKVLLLKTMGTKQISGLLFILLSVNTHLSTVPKTDQL